MKAKDVSGQAPGGKRTPLAEVLPLASPFVIQIFPVYACNFKCGYCIFSVDKAKRGFISDKVFMDFELYKKCIDGISRLPGKIKVLRFVGIGEPLLHKNIAQMIKFAALKNIAERIELLTNGLLLGPRMSDSLISSGLSRLVVSIQGTSKDKYRQICAADVDFNKFIDNLRYFFNNKGKTHVYIKVLDCALDNQDDQAKFYEIFGDICDAIGVEHAVPIHTAVNYENLFKNKDIPLTQFGLPVSEVKICPQPFFNLQVNPDGKIVPCYSFEYPEIMGDANLQSIDQIWNAKPFRNFRQRMLGGIKNMGEVCANCKIIKYRIFPEDVLDNHIQRLKKLYEF